MSIGSECWSTFSVSVALSNFIVLCYKVDSVVARLHAAPPAVITPQQQREVAAAAVGEKEEGLAKGKARAKGKPKKKPNKLQAAAAQGPAKPALRRSRPAGGRSWEVEPQGGGSSSSSGKGPSSKVEQRKYDPVLYKVEKIKFMKEFLDTKQKELEHLSRKECRAVVEEAWKTSDQKKAALAGVPEVELKRRKFL